MERLSKGLAILLLVGLPAMVLAEQSQTEPEGLYEGFLPRGDIRRFDGETIHFDISFLWFENAATAKIRFSKQNGQYLSVLEAQTKGFVGWFTAYRKHVYKAWFDIVDENRRVRTIRFERRVVEGDFVEETVHRLDYVQRRHFWVKSKNGDILEDKSEPIPPGVNFDDILAVFYNFRNEVYGPLTKGANFKIHTIPEKGHGSISVEIHSDEKEKAVRKEEGRIENNELLLNVVVPKEIFKTETGELLFWASWNFIPLETTVKDYVLFGDLHAKFNRREVVPPIPPPSLRQAP